MTALGTTVEDPIAAFLGTGFNRFSSPFGVDGLAKTEGLHLEILAVHSTNPGTGQFRAFIDQCKKEFNTIYILEVWNDDLQSLLERYGFKKTKMNYDNERRTVWTWKTK